ncbi:YitT family protein [Helcococcus kunzii]|uniref:DUF2179 domain-containing protein n=1 Tax=Helcococcus kunzii ATCC 51366 TaxID=883114 RepID=H3NNJ4_9FIRM|nr:YitT family protein [Helcococcus kunzii]EHR33969.1 hypothetical protein HMPREF9709_00905 [Helcococcus kunzii ATCC 51366]MCT1795577.1 YitT family protein [Helcococcus kunzii]MCT1989315.1 YitT family protein [Helcococcus kunzii]QUY64820.1 YitT family protein [Helcococcus kunzii]QZO77261.1 YitT family protein [Helcococcus kunzii]
MVINKKFKRILIIILGAFIMSIGAIFFNIPSNIAAGGVTGLSQGLQELFPEINIGIISAILNILIFILGTALLGKEFGLYTVVGAVSYTLLLGVFDAFVEIKEPILQDKLANLVLGASFIGYGLSIVMKQGGSTGGTDVVAKIIEYKTDVNLSKAILMVDTMVILFATSVFGVQSGIYSFISLYVTTYVLDVAIAGFNSKIQITIISDHVDVINDFIATKINRGTTLYKAMGGYTKIDRNILVSIVDKKQYVKIRNFIEELDDNAFVYITNINEVYGYGFSRENLNVSVRENSETKN